MRNQTKKEKAPARSSTSKQHSKTAPSHGRNHKLLAIFSWLICIFLFIAFTSYLFTWKEDQDKIFSLSYHILLNNDVTVENLHDWEHISAISFFTKKSGLPLIFCVICFSSSA